MRNKLGITCMSLGAVFLVAALSLCLFNRWENERAEKWTEEAIARLQEQLCQQMTDLTDPLDPNMKTVMLDGYEYIGILEIEEEGLILPVLSGWSYEQLKVAPCRYAGAVGTNDLVIAAHNYMTHFGRLKNLSESDRVNFTDMNGRKTEYVVSAMEILQPAAVEDMKAGEYDLTLFTCTYGGKSRVTVRCDRIESGRN